MTDAVADLARLLLYSGPAPCDKFACTVRERCATERLACTSFVRFVHTGRACDPILVLNLRHGPGHRVNEAFVGREPSPTRELFGLCDFEGVPPAVRIDINLDGVKA